MKKAVLSLSLLSFCTAFAGEVRELSGYDAFMVMKESRTVMYNEIATVPSFIVFHDGNGLTNANIFNHLKPVLNIGEDDDMHLYRTMPDQLGMVHYRYQQYYKGIPVTDAHYLVHTKNGEVKSVNGYFVDGLSHSGAATLSEADALQKAIAYIGADIYKWDVPSEEKFIKWKKNDPNATFYPKGTLEFVAVKGDYTKRDIRLAYRFDIYAHEPMSRHYVFVDANTGEVIHEIDRICHVDVNGTANTRYSGTQTITTDNFGPNQYRLQETGRGQGVRTFDLNNGTNYGNAVDFTDSDNNWTTTTNMDDAATDAHWGAECTYDYYVQIHNRNGLDDNGMQMDSYVHYSTNYNNAFWNGSEMTYGDGSNSPGGFTPLTALDVCGHEFTHGVTDFSSNLIYSYESGALNESFSDIFGTVIEFWKKPNDCDWLIGAEIVYTQPGALRSMSNPNQYGDPDTYMSTNPAGPYYTGSGDNGGVHTNSGVQNYWFYLLTTGGSGTNDVGDVYSVTAIGMTDAAAIAFRNNTFYLTTNSQFVDARAGAIQAAQDLFGSCSQQHISCTNAWYAVNVGNAWSTPVVTSSFTAGLTSFCNVPAVVSFSNTSQNANTAFWDFGDGNNSSSWIPTHTYTQSGSYTVTLTVSGGCGSNTTTQTSFVTVNAPSAPATVDGVACTAPSSVTLNASGSGTLRWYANATGGQPVNSGTTYNTPSLSSTTTYYVADEIAQPNGNVGKANNTGGGGNHNSGTPQWLIFDVYQPCTLVSAFVYSSTAGNRNITLWDNAGNVIQTYTVNIPNGNNTLTLNIPLTPGTGYRLGGTNMNLYRNNASAVYPYTLNGVVSITGASAGGGYYYYFYNWTVTPVCTSPRTPVTAFIGGPTVTFAPLTTVCNTNPPFALTGGSPSGGTYSGPGVSSGMFDPSAAGIGTHTITYTYVDANNCTGTATQTIDVQNCLSINEHSGILGWNLYPNPGNGVFNIGMNLGSDQEVTLSLMNAVGQLVKSETYQLSSGANTLIFDADVSNGVYMLSLKTNVGVVTRRVEVIR